MAVSQQLLFKLGADSRDLRAKLRQVKTDVRNALRDVAVLGGAIGVESVRRAVDFQASMAEVNTIMRGSPAEVAALSKEMLRLSMATGATTKELVGGLYDALSAGVPKENAVNFLTVATKAAIAGVTDTKTAVNGMTSVMTGWAVAAADTEKVADAFFATVRLGKTTFADLSANIGKVGPTASAMGVSFEETMAALATLTLTGMKTEQAATSLRGALVALSQPSPKLQEALSKIGYSSATAMLEALPFQEALAKLAGTTDGTAEAMRDLFPNVEGMQGVLGLVGINAANAASHLRQVTNSAGDMGVAFTEMANTGKASLNQLMASVNSSLIQIGTELIPTVRSLADTMRGIAGDPEKLQGLVEIFRGLGMAIEFSVNGMLKLMDLLEFASRFTLLFNMIRDAPNLATVGERRFNKAAISDADVAAAREMMRARVETGLPDMRTGEDMYNELKQIKKTLADRMPEARTVGNGISGGSL